MYSLKLTNSSSVQDIKNNIMAGLKSKIRDNMKKCDRKKKSGLFTLDTIEEEEGGEGGEGDLSKVKSK